MTRFLVEGAFPEAVDELAALQDERSLPAWFRHGRHLRVLFHHHEARKDAEFLFRLALVCEAATPAQAMGTSLLPGCLAIPLASLLSSQPASLSDCGRGPWDRFTGEAIPTSSRTAGRNVARGEEGT